MGGLGSGPRWGLGRLGLERATLRTSPYGMASEGQESQPFSRSEFKAAADIILDEKKIGINQAAGKGEKDALGVWTCADLTFADQTFADGHFSISYYKKPSGSRGRARRALTKRVILKK